MDSHSHSHSHSLNLSVLGDLKGNVLNCTAERLLGDMEDPDFMGSSCHYKGQEIVENRKCTGFVVFFFLGLKSERSVVFEKKIEPSFCVRFRWYCDPFVYGTTIVDAFIYTENNRVEAPLREVISYSTNEEVLLGSMLMDIASFWKTKPSSRVWTVCLFHFSIKLRRIHYQFKKKEYS